MDHNLSVIVEFEPDDLEQVAAEVGSDGEHFRGITVWIEADHDQAVGDGVVDRRVAHSVLTRRTVNLHL